MPLIPCPLCGCENSHEVKTCLGCGHTLGAGHSNTRAWGLAWAIPFTIIGCIGLVLAAATVLDGKPIEPPDLFMMGGPIVLGFGLSLIGWVKVFRK